jgi:hypothetical protein
MMQNSEYFLAGMIGIVVWHVAMRNREFPMAKIIKRYFILNRFRIGEIARRLLIRLFECVLESERGKWNAFATAFMPLIDSLPLNKHRDVIYDFELGVDSAALDQKLLDWESLIVMRLLVNSASLSFMLRESTVSRTATMMLNPEYGTSERFVSDFVSCLSRHLVRPMLYSLKRLCGISFVERPANKGQKRKPKMSRKSTEVFEHSDSWGSFSSSDD